jgi:hypothetical protein
MAGAQRARGAVVESAVRRADTIVRHAGHGCARAIGMDVERHLFTALLAAGRAANITEVSP